MKPFFYLLLIPVLAFSQSSLDDVEALFQKKQYEKAEKICVHFLENHQNNLKAIELLGDAYGYQKKWDKAIEAYEKLINANKNVANYHYKYGGVLGMKALENKLKAIGFIGDIKNAFLTAAKLDPKHIEARWALVELYMQLPGIIGGSKSKSLQFAQELENLSKLDGYLAKGYVYEYDDEPELAESYYKKAIHIDIELKQRTPPRNALHYQIGKVAAEYNVQLEKGELYLKAYLKNYSSSDGVPKAWAYYRLSQIKTHYKNKKEALKYIDIALAELPEIKPFITHKQKVLSLWP